MTWFRRQPPVAPADSSSPRSKSAPALGHPETRRAHLLDRLPGLGYRCGLDRRLLAATRGALEVTGYRPSDLVQGGPRLDDLIHPEDRPEVARRLETAVARAESAHFSYRLTGRDGVVRRVWETVWPRRNSRGEVRELEGFIASVGEEPSASGNGVVSLGLKQRLHDPLTGLSERTLLCDRLDQALRRRGRHPSHAFALLLIDLDNFRSVNDLHGRDLADRLLEATARRLEACVRQEDTVARIAGDQFAVLLAEISGVGDAVRVAERVDELLDLPLFADREPVQATASVGVVFGPAQYQRPKEVLRDAETAMCRAKVRGGATFELFDPASYNRELSRLRLETDLRKALTRRQLSLLYQPIVELPSGRIEGFEALLRWHHPERGLLRPEEFLQSAVESGLIVPITWWILAQACSRIATWRSAAPSARDLYVSINVNSRQLQCEDLLDRIRDALDRTGLEPQGLRIEIKESALMGGEPIVAALSGLRELGVQLALDDFGTGYSSVAALASLPIHSLKVDRSLVAGIEDGQAESTAMLRTVLSMAEGLTMEVVGEGVERAVQADRLRELGCTSAQGFYFAHPLAPKRITEMLSNGALNGAMSQAAPS